MLYYLFFLMVALIIGLVVAYFKAEQSPAGIIAFFLAAVLLFILSAVVQAEGVDFPGNTRITENVGGDANITDVNQFYDFNVNPSNDGFMLFVQWFSLALGVSMLVWTIPLVFSRVMNSGRRNV